MPRPSILIIDDDAEIRYSLDRVLAPDGHLILTADSGEQGIEVAQEKKPNLIFLDHRMGGISGIETLQHLRTAAPTSLVILMTAYGTTQTAIQAMKHGAFDYVLKPFDLAKLKEMVAKALKASADAGSPESVTKRLLKREDIEEGIVGSGEKMQQVLKKIGQVAASEASVMVTGESGTGKELVARCIHRYSHRAEGPFHAVNCGAIPENLIESELFGHEKGAFTGASTANKGIFRAADGGTLLLDEISEMPLGLQAKLLRALQERKVTPLGSQREIDVDVRVVATTNRNMLSEVKEGRFREDLFYRLNVFPLVSRHLHERNDDIVAISTILLKRHAANLDALPALADDAIELLLNYGWPGNVRELENVLQRALVLCSDNMITAGDIMVDGMVNEQLTSSRMMQADSQQFLSA